MGVGKGFIGMVGFFASPIDWSATGSMLAGIGAMVGSGAVIYAARVGRSTFHDWKRQKNEGRRIDLAEQILALAYKLKRAFQGIRSPGMLGWEATETIKKLTEAGMIDESTAGHIRSGLATAQATLLRADHHKPLFDELLDTMPVAKAIFGEEIEKALNTFWVQRAKVMTAAQVYADIIRRNEPRDERRLDDLMERRDRTEAIFWEGGGRDGVDVVADAIDAATVTLEAKLFPILRHEE